MWKGFQRAETSPSIFDEEEDPNPTIFNWVKNRRSWVHLTAFLVFSVVIHGSGFYLFQVVYPSPTREKPRADTISLMDPADPNIRSLLQRVSDRMTFLLPPSEATGVQISIDELPVRFTPSFQTTEMSPEELAFSWTMPPSEAVIGAGFSTSEKTFENPVILTAQGELMHREVAPWSILEDYLGLAEQIPAMRLKLVVDEEGMVKVEEVESELDSQAEGEIKQVVESTLRYLPEARSSSGWLAIRTKD
ncbi:MAG: hypothetical protein P1U58_05580 [Verrucomicrobiales bacterium]|nr:hypothetical protein [Verrucomicrobiales bacterium]